MKISNLYRCLFEYVAKFLTTGGTKNIRKKNSFCWTAQDFEIQKPCVRTAFADDIYEHEH